MARPTHKHLYWLNHLIAPATIFSFGEPPFIDEVYIQEELETWNLESRYEHPDFVELKVTKSCYQGS